MKNDSIVLLSNLNRVQSQQQSVTASFPSSQQIQGYQQLAHELRSMAIGESLKSMMSYFNSVWADLKKRRAHHKALAELDQLDAFMLKDIGLTRSDVESLRYGSTTVEQLNERRSRSISDRLKINQLQLCLCNEKLDSKIMSEPLRLAKCG